MQKKQERNKKHHKKLSREQITFFRKSIFEWVENFLNKKVLGTKISLDLLICVPLLSVAIYFYSSFKVEMMKYIPGYTPKQDLGMFWSETAFQYRYAKMFGENDPNKWEILKNDINLQYPDGVNTWKDYTTFMEPVHGYFYHYFISKNVPFHIYIMWFVSIFSSFLAFLIYGIVKSVWKMPFLALICSMSWMLIPVSFYRQVSNIYLKEDFSIVFILLFICLFIKGLKDKNIKIPIYGGVALFISLISWHFSQFMFLLFMLNVFLSYVITSEWETHHTRNLFIYTISGFIAGFVPVLWQRTFFFSQPMLIGYALLITISTERIWRKKVGYHWYIRTVFPSLLILIFFTSNLIFNAHLKEYAHVFQLFWYKIIYFGKVSSNPSDLPFDARVFWAGNFNNYKFAEINDNFLALLIVLIISPIVYFVFIIKKKLNIQEIYIFFMLLGTGLATILVARLIIFLTVMLAISIGFVIKSSYRIDEIFPSLNSKISKWKNMKIYSIYIAYLIILIPMGINFSLYKTLSPSITDDKIEYRTELFDWIKSSTLSGDAFVSSIGDGPMILLYTGRPVILNSQYENSFIRRRTEEFDAAFYGDEKKLYEFCKKYGVKYIAMSYKMVLPVNPGSGRYNACANEKLYVKTPAAMIQFYPDSLKYFIPVYDNSAYRVMRVLYENEMKTNYTWVKGYSSIFDPALFKRNGDYFVETDETMARLHQADDIVKENEKIFVEIRNIMTKYPVNKELNSNDNASIESNVERIRNNMKKAVQINPREFTYYFNSGVLEAQIGRFDAALNFFMKGIKLAPGDKGLQTVTFDILSRLQKWQEMITLGEELLREGSNRPFLLAMTGYANLRANNFKKAYDLSNESIKLLENVKEKKNINDYANAYSIRGISSFYLGDIQNAESDLMKFDNSVKEPSLRDFSDKILKEINLNGRNKKSNK